MKQERFGDGRDWFFKKRFGLFVHWGLYAIPAWHEQQQYLKRVPRQEYEKLTCQFNPTHFNPDAWLDMAEDVGMEYICFTTKHIDGFCLWQTAQTDYNVMNTPYGKDILKQVAEACHRRNFPLCLYYSIPDLHHPNYPHANLPYELVQPESGDEPDFEKYMAFLKAQVRELCTQYGEIHGFWWDANVKKYQDFSINEMIRSLQPNAMINNRGFDEGDFGTPERDWYEFVDKELAFDKPVEACQSVGTESWGYREDEDYFTPKYLIQCIDKIMAKGGNYLLNVGPRADGTFPSEAVEIIQKIGKWYHDAKESFDNVKPASEIIENRDVLLTRRDNTLYIHLFMEPKNTRVLLNPIKVLPQKAILLNTSEKVNVRVDILPSFQEKGQKCLQIRNLPVNDISDSVLVVKLQFDKLPE